jgi:hypothetical protein
LRHAFSLGHSVLTFLPTNHGNQQEGIKLSASPRGRLATAAKDSSDTVSFPSEGLNPQRRRLAITQSLAKRTMDNDCRGDHVYQHIRSHVAHRKVEKSTLMPSGTAVRPPETMP